MVSKKRLAFCAPTLVYSFTNYYVYITSTKYTVRLCGELLRKHLLEGLTILSELLDTLVQLVERHLVLEQCPAELGLVVDVGDLGEVLVLGG